MGLAPWPRLHGRRAVSSHDLSSGPGARKVPLITLVLFSGSRTIMGTLANSPIVSALAIGGSVIVLSINVLLLLSLLLPA